MEPQDSPRSDAPFDELKEKCAVFGIFNHPEAGNLTYLGLYALQHRGQEGCGIATMDGERMIIRKGEGLVSEYFRESVISELKGRSAVGHNRYSTAGSDSQRNLQPLSATISDVSMALVHNGNLTNAVELRKSLEEEGALFTTDVDTEVLVHMIARSRGEDLVSRMETALASVKGSYSLLALLPHALIGIRDPHGFRPLSIGKLGDSYVLASETCAFDLIGAKYVRDVEPGEMVIITEAGLDHFRLFPKIPSAACIFELIYFARPDSRVFGIPVYQARKRLGRRLAMESPVDADIVVPVPDSGLAPALGYSEQSGIPIDMGLIRNHYVGRTFIEPRQSIRHFGVKIKLNAVPGLLAGKRIVVIDDSIVRGTTSRKIVSMLREAGAREVHMRITSAPIHFPCFYGIDTPNRGELIASTHSLDEIRRYIKADSLGYLPIDAMEEEVSLCQEKREAEAGMTGSFCKACFDGNYPIAFTQEERIQHGLFDRPVR
ncbi:MAG: amidophosphoribosyltransferase [Nitrospirae bacterium]|jgi:amidophosphoribosyltransferase|nr:amidophosphoribosyltransferase [Nitrospirota bacterium]MCL5285001.1 amidophosphoribosyltransferase [Nitrospirota bacterium]